MSDDLDDWENMAPVGREWGADNAETLWMLDEIAYRLAGTGLCLTETESDWRLSWCARTIALWTVEQIDLKAMRRAVAEIGGPDALLAWDQATGGLNDDQAA